MSDYYKSEMNRLHGGRNGQDIPRAEDFVFRSEHQQRVEDFMSKAGQDVPEAPCMPDEHTRILRAKLIMEEAMETVEALGVDVTVPSPMVAPKGGVPVDRRCLQYEINKYREPDLVLVADGCADVMVVTTGTLSACGIRDKPLQEAVDQSNLDKFRGDAHRAPSGKWIKPSDWQPPDIAGIITAQGWKADQQTES